MTDQTVADAKARARTDAKAHEVAEALLAWRRNPTARTWDAVFARLRDYERAKS